MTRFELDHILIFTDMDAPGGDRLTALGLTEGAPNVHPGQGTTNRRFFFHNAMLELIWVHNPEEAQQAITRPTYLWERWRGRHQETLPFGLCLRPGHRAPEALPFAASAYTPAYLPSPWVIHLADNASILTEPMLFYTVFGGRPDQADTSYPVDHAIGFQKLTSLRIQGPQAAPPSAAWRAVVDMGIATMEAGDSALMEIGFDGEARGQSLDLRPALPLVLRW